jgi:hypothetical protein
MMRRLALSEAVLAAVVAEISAKQDPGFVNQLVAIFMRRQPVAGSYIASHQQELGVQGVLLVLLHAAILCMGIERGSGRKLGKLTAPYLDGASEEAKDEAAFTAAEPTITDYLQANVADDATLETPDARARALYVLRLVALAANARA